MCEPVGWRRIAQAPPPLGATLIEQKAVGRACRVSIGAGERLVAIEMTQRVGGISKRIAANAELHAGVGGKPFVAIERDFIGARGGEFRKARGAKGKRIAGGGPPRGAIGANGLFE